MLKARDDLLAGFGRSPGAPVREALYGVKARRLHRVVATLLPYVYVAWAQRKTILIVEPATGHGEDLEGHSMQNLLRIADAANTHAGQGWALHDRIQQWQGMMMGG